MSELSDFRHAKNQFFKTNRQSPLTAEQKPDFEGLSYFPENSDLNLEVEVEELPEKGSIQMETTTGGEQTYQRYGRFKFEVDGQEATLTIYADGNGYFLPFVDALAGKETYPAGRYLEPEPLGNNRFAVDFNMAYNPYCAYNAMWTCPLTPFENRLKVPIRAGEKIPEGDWAKHGLE
jgi:uncharacterized protein (DUF1684 family)